MEGRRFIFFLLSLAFATRATAAVCTWNPAATGTSWSAASNWCTSVPQIGDIAEFAAGTYNAQPSLSSLGVVDGISVTGSAAVTIGGNTVLTLTGTESIDGRLNTGIALEASAGPLTINAPLVVANDQNWYNNSPGTLAINGDISGGALRAPWLRHDQPCWFEFFFRQFDGGRQ